MSNKYYTKANLFNIFASGVAFTGMIVGIRDSNYQMAIVNLFLVLINLGVVFGNEIISKFNNGDMEE